MTNVSQEVSSQEENRTNPQLQVSDPISKLPQKSNKKIWMIVGVIVTVFCLCLIIFVAVLGAGMVKVYKEKAPVESVLDAYMRHMLNKDAESAYVLFSPRAQRQVPISKLQELLEGNNYILFEGYQSLSISNINISATVNTNPDLPQGTVAKVTGVLKFEGNIQGSFNGVLEKVDGKWMIDGINITVPPEKIK